MTPRTASGIGSPVLLVVSGGTVSYAAITRAGELAEGAPVIVVGVGQGPAESGGTGSPPGRGVSGGSSPGESGEQVRRAVALAMSALENTGVMALGHIAVTGSPARTVARVARARGARVVVLDRRGVPGLAAELRRRVYGSGIVVVSAAGRGGRWLVPS